jgi:hypothetical protein
MTFLLAQVVSMNFVHDFDPHDSVLQTGWIVESYQKYSGECRSHKPKQAASEHERQLNCESTRPPAPVARDLAAVGRLHWSDFFLP